ncbi:MAG: 30S ribosomal protein S1 [Bacteroidetes bacterium]|nr:30S ribosomal protein S1 [Bacteroidota bacterium]
MTEEVEDPARGEKVTDTMVMQSPEETKTKKAQPSRVKLLAGDDSPYSEAELKEMVDLYDKSLKQFDAGEIVKGRIIGLTDNDVIVDIGFKSSGLVPKIEFPNLNELKAGDEVEVFLDSVEDQDGQVVLSRRRADFIRIWDRIVDAHENQTVLQGTVLRRVKGGLMVNLMGLESFLPGSQVDVKPVRDFDSFVGKTMDFRVVKINEAAENVVVSHKALLEAELEEQRKRILSKLEKGLILEGNVKAITEFGVFVDLGGVDGLIHITDLSWGRVNHPSEIVKLDQKIQVVVTDFDEEKKRISLSMKALKPEPWKSIEDKYQVGQRANGKVVSLTEYGAFVEIEKGIEGLIHISEMSWTEHVKHPSQKVSMGQTIEAVILSLDKDNKKLSLGLKQLDPDPWEQLIEKYPVDSKHKGIVRNLTNFGVFVELESGVDGLIHISDLSWTKKIRHPGELVKRGDEIDVVVLSVDKEQRRISLGHKQALDNPWDKFEQEFRTGSEVVGKVIRHIEKGAIVELPGEVDGFIPHSHMSPNNLKNFSAHFPAGESLNLKVIEFDKDGKRIVLSALEYFKDKDAAQYQEFLAAHKISPDERRDRRPRSTEKKPKEQSEASQRSDATGSTQTKETAEAENHLSDTGSQPEEDRTGSPSSDAEDKNTGDAAPNL